MASEEAVQGGPQVGAVAPDDPALGRRLGQGRAEAQLGQHDAGGGEGAGAGHGGGDLSARHAVQELLLAPAGTGRHDAQVEPARVPGFAEQIDQGRMGLGVDGHPAQVVEGGQAARGGAEHDVLAGVGVGAREVAAPLEVVAAGEAPGHQVAPSLVEQREGLLARPGGDGLQPQVPLAGEHGRQLVLEAGLLTVEHQVGGRAGEGDDAQHALGLDGREVPVELGRPDALGDDARRGQGACVVHGLLAAGQQQDQQGGHPRSWRERPSGARLCRRGGPHVPMVTAVLRPGKAGSH